MKKPGTGVQICDLYVQIADLHSGREENEMISQETVESVKSKTDLVALIRSRGVELKKKGRNYIGLCPFHNDTEPSLSVNPAKNLWNCFGCGAGGDAVRFVEMFDKLEFPDAVRQLAGAIPGAVPADSSEAPAETYQTIGFLILPRSPCKSSDKKDCGPLVVQEGKAGSKRSSSIRRRERGCT